MELCSVWEGDEIYVMARRNTIANRVRRAASAERYRTRHTGGKRKGEGGRRTGSLKSVSLYLPSRPEVFQIACE